jgi:hypothetical protein
MAEAAGVVERLRPIDGRPHAVARGGDVAQKPQREATFRQGADLRVVAAVTRPAFEGT